MVLHPIDFMFVRLPRTVIVSAVLLTEKPALPGRRKHGGDCGRGKEA